MMNTEDQELLEIEKMLETMKETEPAPELRGQTLSKARKAWQESSNISFGFFFKLGAAAIIIFSLGYYLGAGNGKIKNETAKEKKDATIEEFQKQEKEKGRIMKGER